jgi:hypothetical protein
LLYFFAPQSAAREFDLEMKSEDQTWQTSIGRRGGGVLPAAIDLFFTFLAPASAFIA